MRWRATWSWAVWRTTNGVRQRMVTRSQPANTLGSAHDPARPSAPVPGDHGRTRIVEHSGLSGRVAGPGEPPVPRGPRIYLARRWRRSRRFQRAAAARVSPADSAVQAERPASTSYCGTPMPSSANARDFRLVASRRPMRSSCDLTLPAGFTLRSRIEEAGGSTSSGGIDHWSSQLRRPPTRFRSGSG